MFRFYFNKKNKSLKFLLIIKIISKYCIVLYYGINKY